MNIYKGEQSIKELNTLKNISKDKGGFFYSENENCYISWKIINNILDIDSFDSDYQALKFITKK